MYTIIREMTDEDYYPHAAQGAPCLRNVPQMERNSGRGCSGFTSLYSEDLLQHYKATVFQKICLAN